MSGAKLKRQWALAALEAGLQLIPLKPNSKQPAFSDWPDKPFANEGDLLRYLHENPSANLGVLTGAPSGIFVLDRDGQEGRRALQALVEHHGKLPKTVRVQTRNGEHWYFKAPEGRVPNSVSKIGTALDIRGDRGYVVMAGSKHPAGPTYKYKDGRAVGQCEIAAAPEWLLDLVTAANLQRAPEPQAIPEQQRGRAQAYFNRAEQLEHQRLRNAPAHQRNDTLNRCAFKLGQLIHMTSASEKQILLQLISIACEIGLTRQEAVATSRSGLKAGRASPRRLPSTVATSGPAEKSAAANDSDDRLAEKLADLAETDADNAERFVARFGDIVLHCPVFDWFVFDGRIWRPDQQKKRIELAIKTAEAIANEADHISTDRGTNRRKFSLDSKSKGGLERMLSLAESRLFIASDRLDSSPDLLSVRNGTIDLKTGLLLPHDPADLITNIVDIDYDPAAVAPRFIQFLKECTNDDPERIAFLRSAAGYTLTGHTREKALFFGYGEGDTGKTLFQLLLADMLGSYAKLLPIEALLAKTYDAIPNDLARLKGARFVSVSEANHNRRLDEAKVKLLTGGDRICARFMRQEYFEYVPQFKLWIAANDQPRVRATDGALWERINVIPFSKGYAKKDNELIGKLRKELPGILAWAVGGARQWYRAGLPHCQDVEAATDHWRASVQVSKQFYYECCEVAQGQKVPAKDMYARFQKWCVDNGETAISIKEFAGRMMELNVTPGRTGKGRFWRDIKLVN